MHTHQVFSITKGRGTSTNIPPSPAVGHHVSITKSSVQLRSQVWGWAAIVMTSAWTTFLYNLPCWLRGWPCDCIDQGAKGKWARSDQRHENPLSVWTCLPGLLLEYSFLLVKRTRLSSSLLETEGWANQPRQMTVPGSEPRGHWLDHPAPPSPNFWPLEIETNNWSL